MGTGYALWMTAFNATWLNHAIALIEVDYQHSADTDPIALAAELRINRQLA